jgi:sulfur transfer protein SufE
MGVITGLAILILQRYLNPDVVHQLLTFNPADFFTCAGLSRARAS